MNKKEVQKRVLQNGKPLALKKFSWCEKTKTFSVKEDYLIIDFAGIGDCTFTTGGGCTFTTGWDCTFKTGGDCTFTTGWDCTFTTGWDCTFTTGGGCTFTTGWDCTFTTGGGCTFTTGGGCTFKTGGDCTFKTGGGCTFTTGGGCTWVFDWGKLQEPPLHFCGSRYYIEFSKPGFIQSGCIEKPLDWWQKNVTRCAEEHGYSLSQVREYEMYVKFLGQWMERLKLHKAKGKGEK